MSLEKIADEFYRTKTFSRIQQWIKKYPNFTENPSVNGKLTPPLQELLELVPWEKLSKESIPCFFHGDLQPDNILCTENSFLLLDWRQDFAGCLELGDLYYDLAKLRGGILLNYRLIKEGKWQYKPGHFSLPGYANQYTFLHLLDEYIAKRGLDLERIKIMNGIIFANMAPLHTEPFDRLLWDLARETLFRELGSQ